MTREATTYDKIIGIKDNEIWILKDSFKYSDGFKGVTGYHMGVLTQDIIDDKNDFDNLCNEYGYLWREAVENESTEYGLEDYIKMLQSDFEINGDGLFFGDDTSFRYQTEELIDNLPADQKAKLEEVFGAIGEDYVTWTVSGCGRCLNPDDEWDIIFNPDLIDVIKKFENNKGD